MDLPKGWAMAELQDLLIINPKSTIKVKDAFQHQNCEFPFYTSGKRILSYNAFLVEDENCFIATGGHAIFSYYKGRAAYSTDTLSVKVLLANTKYLHYFLLSQSIHIDKKLFRGTGLRHLQKNEFFALSVPLPPLAEQHRIAAKIDALFSELDKGIETLQTVRQQLRTYRQAVLKWAFEGEEWERVTIDRFLSKKIKPMSTGPFGTMLNKQEHQSSGVPVLGIENIGRGAFKYGNKIFVTPEKAEYLKSFMLHTNDVIISRSGTVGELCLVPKSMDGALLSTNLIRVTLDESVIMPKFFVHLFLSKGIVIDQVKELCRGSTRDFLNQTILKQILFPLPPLSEQTQIVAAIESRLSVCDKLEAIVDESLAKAQALRQSILKKAFAGQLVLQDPDDEPAQALLERIKAAQKAAAKPKKAGRKQHG